MICARSQRKCKSNEDVKKERFGEIIFKVQRDTWTDTPRGRHSLFHSVRLSLCLGRGTSLLEAPPPAAPEK